MFQPNVFDSRAVLPTTTRRSGFRALAFALLCFISPLLLPAAAPEPLLAFDFEGDAADVTGKGFDATVNGPVLAADRFGRADSAYRFDGADDFIALPDEAGQYPVGDLTFAAWVRIDSLDGKGQIRLLNINSAASSRTSYNGGTAFSVLVDGDQVLLNYGAVVEDRQDEGFGVTGSTPLPIGEFIHVAVVRDAAEVRLYLNGVATDQATALAGPIEYDYEVYDIDVVEIGRFNRGRISNAGGIDNPENKFDGVIDDLALYDQALSAAEIAKLATDPTVTFDLDGRATADEPAALNQTVPEGDDATAPAFTVEPSWIFTGWDAPLTGITADRTITAQYASDIDRDGVADADDPDPDGLPDHATARQALDIYTGTAEAPGRRALPDQAVLPAEAPEGEIRFRFFENEDTQGLQPIPEWSRDLGLADPWKRRGFQLDRGPVEDGRRLVEARLGDRADEPRLFFRLRTANPPPEPTDDSAALDGNASAALDLLANDRDAGGETALTITALDGDPDTIGQTLTLPGGTLTLGADGAATVTPDPALAAGEQRSASLAYTVTDPFGRSTDATLALTFTGVNDPPTVSPPDGLAITEGSDFAFDPNLFGSDVDDGDTLTFTTLDGKTPPTQGNPLELASGGRLVRESDGSLRYEPTPRFGAGASGTESFSYTLEDGSGATAQGTASFTVDGLNSPPQTLDPSRSVTVGNDASLPLGDLGLDVDTGDSFVPAKVAGQAIAPDASLELASGLNVTRLTGDDLRVTPRPEAFLALAEGQNQTVTFSYTLEDGDGAATQGTASVTVTGVNDPPVASADSFTVAEDDLLDPANLEPGLQWTFYEVDAPVTADTDFAGVAPVAGGFLSGINQDLSPGTVDPFPDTGEDKATALVLHGFMEVPQDGIYTFHNDYINTLHVTGRHHVEVAGAPIVDRLHEPIYDFTIPVSLSAGVHGLRWVDTAFNQNGGTVAEEIATAIFRAGFFPTKPRAEYLIDDNPGWQVGRQLRPKPLPTSLFANDTDPDTGDTLAPVAINGHPVTPGMGLTLPSGAFASIDADGGLRYNPTPADALRSLGAGESFTDSFTYTVADAAGATAQSTVEVTVNGVDNPPIARTDLFEPADTDLDAPIAVPSVLANDLDDDPDGSLSVVAVGGSAANVGQPVTLPSGATVTLQADGTGTYDAVGVPLRPYRNSGETKVDTTEIIDGEEVVTGQTFEVHPTFAAEGGAILEGDYVIEKPLTYTVEDAAGQRAQAALNIRVEGSNAGPEPGASGDFSGLIPSPEAIGSTSQTSQYAFTNLEEGALEWATAPDQNNAVFQTDIIPEGITRTYKPDYDVNLELKQYNIKFAEIQPDTTILPSFKNAIEIDGLCKTGNNQYRYAITNNSNETAKLIVNSVEMNFDSGTTTEIEVPNDELTINVGTVNLGRFQGSEDPCQDFDVSFDQAVVAGGSLFVVVTNNDDATRWFRAENRDTGDSSKFEVGAGEEETEELIGFSTSGEIVLEVSETDNGPWFEVGTRPIQQL